MGRLCPTAGHRLEALWPDGKLCEVEQFNRSMPRNERHLLLGFWIAVTLITGARLLFGLESGAAGLLSLPA